MYSGTNVILITNNEPIVNLLSSELVQLRNIDSILIRTYQDALSSIESEKPQAIILNCKNSMEEPFCLDLIKKIKGITSVPILLLVENYNSQFIRIANKAGIDDVVAVQFSNSEILMRTIWSLQKNELRQQHKKYEKLLTQLNAIDEETGFYTAKYSSKVFQNEMDYLSSKGIDGVFIALEPNEKSRLKPSTENIVETIKNNIRATDTVALTKYKNTFYLLLANTNLEGSLVVWNRLNKNIGADETLCGCIYNMDKSSFDEIEEELKEGLKEAKTAPNLLYIIDSNVKKNDNWLEESKIPSQNTHKNFKLFRQIFSKKLEKVVKPTVEELLKEYEDVLSGTDIPLVETETSYSVKFVNKRQESEFTITQEGNSVVVESKHNGLDSPENKKYSMNLNEITTKEINNDFEDFILEFKSCL